MEILSSSRRGFAGDDSPASAIGSGSASKFNTRLDNRSSKLSFYQSAAHLEVSLEDFESFAVDRFIILKGLEDGAYETMAVATMRRARGGIGGHEIESRALKGTHFRGVRKQPWGRFAVKIRDPWTEVRMWPGTFDSTKHGLSFRSDKDLPDLAIQKAEKPTLWPDPEICMGSRPLSDSFQIQISQPSGRTIMQWVSPSDLVQELKLNLERRMGIPSSLMRLLFQGKQLEDPLPLSSYSISRNSLVVATLHLRGGAVGQSSSTRPFSYKDAVHFENPKPPEALKSKVFLVDKIEEVPSVELIHEELASHLQDFAERAIICRFNGLWPRSQDLYAWIHANWTHHCKIFFCSKGYFIVLFDNNKHYEKALEEGPWFMGTAGLFLTPWFPDFDPATAVITKTPVWIRLPNLPAHLWSTRVFRAIGDTLGSFIQGDLWRESKGLYSYARVCVELDLSKGLPEQINLKINDFVWIQTLDYENTSFRCRHCHQSGHLQNTCPSRPAKKNKANVSKPKSKRWAPCSPPPVADSDSSSSEDEDSDEELNQAPHFVAPSTDGLVPSSDSAIAQKRAHLSSSSDSEREGSPVEDLNLQVVIAHPPQNGWVEVKKRKGKKLCVETSTLSG